MPARARRVPVCGNVCVQLGVCISLYARMHARLYGCYPDRGESSSWILTVYASLPPSRIENRSKPVKRSETLGANPLRTAVPTGVASILS